ncbi:MAG: tetratricopeptide repeat protein [Mizugakiibacter sp.]|uniref:tetratricopeptide repeat protein n=1 Tax=Mizugakiibacter sp. TaxID=1972610 RepID=UPI0031C4ACF9|nr:tetratricopeptide repeat protein [Xanthomonadaceae bacterium]
MRSGRRNIKQLRQFAAVGALALGALAGCAQAPQRPTAQAHAAAAQPLARLQLPAMPVEQDLAAQLMAGEFALAQNDLKASAQAYAKAAALSADPRVAERAVGLAIAVNDADLAARGIARWTALGADAAGLAQARAQLALSHGDRDEAQRQLMALTATGDAGWRACGRVLSGARDAALAGALLEAVATPARMPPKNESLWVAMSQLGAKLGRHAYAQRIADAALQRFGGTASYAWAAQLKLQAGDKAGAKALWGKALAKSPRDARLRLGYASLLGELGENAEAARVLAVGPQDATTYAARAAFAARADDKRALARLYAELKGAGAGVRDASQYLLGQVAELLGRSAEALKWYEQVPHDDEHAFDAVQRSAVLLDKMGRGDDAHALARELQQDYVGDPARQRQAYALDAELYGRADAMDQAAAVYTRALGLFPDDTDLLYGRALAWAETGRTADAVRDLRRVLELKPDDVDAMNALGYTLADSNQQLGEAETLLRQALAKKPDEPALIDSWGWLQYRLGHLDQAAQYLARAWDAHKDPEVGAHYGEVLWVSGNRDAARKVFDEAHKLDPKNRALNATLQRLRP